MTIRKLFFLFICILNIAYAKTIHNLDIEKSIKYALEKNYRIQISNNELLQNKLRLKSSINSYKTNIYLNANLPNHTETMRTYEDSSGIYYYPVKQTIYESNLIIRQPLPTDGNFYLQFGAYSLRDYYTDINTMQINSRLKFEQPLEAFYSYNNIKYSKYRAELNYELSKINNTQANLDLKYEVNSLFYSLLSKIERRKIAKQSMESQDELYQLTKRKFNSGLIAEIEFLQMEVDLGQATNDYYETITDLTAEKNEFKQLVGIPLQDSIVIEGDFSYVAIKIDIDKAVERGIKFNQNIKKDEINKKLVGMNIKYIAKNDKITGKLSAYYDFIGTSSNDLSLAYSTAFENTYDELKNHSGNRGIALSLNIPILDWRVNELLVEAEKVKLKNIKYSLENNKISIEKDIRKTVNIIESNLRRLKLLEKNVKVAEKSFSISKKKYANGDINSQTLAFNREQLNQAKQSWLDAFIQYKLMISDLNRKTHYNYEENEYY